MENTNNEIGQSISHGLMIVACKEGGRPIGGMPLKSLFKSD
jgi:hypothetical protein